MNISYPFKLIICTLKTLYNFFGYFSLFQWRLREFSFALWALSVWFSNGKYAKLLCEIARDKQVKICYFFPFFQEMSWWWPSPGSMTAHKWLFSGADQNRTCINIPVQTHTRTHKHNLFSSTMETHNSTPGKSCSTNI